MFWDLREVFEIHHYPHIVDRHALKDFFVEHPQLLGNADQV